MRNSIASFLLLMSFFLQSFVYPEASDITSEASSNGDKTEDKKDKETKDEKSETKSLKIGNLSLPTSQQPGPLIGFGENIIDKGQLQVFVFADQYEKRKGYMIDAIPSILYGITDNFSIFINAPAAIRYKEKKHHSSDIEDAFIQLEYAFYNKEELLSTDQATVVGNVTFPTGSYRQNPHTGVGAPSFFLGVTYNHTAIDWFYFGGLGALLTTFHHNTKFANQYLYEMGFGRNIVSPPGWIFAWMVEIDGQYGSKDIVQGRLDPDSGGNVIYITPSLWISSEKLIVQIGAGTVIEQHLFGDQSRYTWQAAVNFGWLF